MEGAEGRGGYTVVEKALQSRCPARCHDQLRQGAWRHAKAGAAEGITPLAPKLPRWHRCHSLGSDPSCYKLLLPPLLTKQPDTESISHVGICSGENTPATRTHYLS